MTRSNDDVKKILQRFPTERYKQFTYSTRPVFTITLGIGLIGLGWFHILSMPIACWLLAAFVLDNVALTPIMGAINAVNHILNGRKTFKSWILLTMIGLSLVTGAYLGFFYFAHIPVIRALLSNYMAITSCSPFLISMGAMFGAYVSHSTHKIPLFWGVFLGSCIASIIYIPVPLALEITYFSAVSIAFLTTIATKNVLQAYYKFSYGDTNADGYNVAKTPKDLDLFFKKQAQLLEVQPNDVRRLAEHCRKKIKEVKSNATVWEEYMLYRQYITNSYKDIYHGLMNPKMTAEDAKIVKSLIAKTILPTHLNTPGKPEKQRKVAIALRRGTFFHPDLEERKLVHRFKIAEGGGLDADLIQPFTPGFSNSGNKLC